MKKVGLRIGILGLLLFVPIGLQAQTTQTSLNQIELTRQFLGTWEENSSNDTIGAWEGKLYGEAVEAHVYLKANGSKIDSYITLFGFDRRDGKLKGYNYFPNSQFATWIGAFTTEKIFKIDGLDSFKPEVIWWKAEFEFKSPTEVILRNFNHSGEKTAEYTFIKVQ